MRTTGRLERAAWGLAALGWSAFAVAQEPEDPHAERADHAEHAETRPSPPGDHAGSESTPVDHAHHEGHGDHQDHAAHADHDEADPHAHHRAQMADRIDEIPQEMQDVGIDDTKLDNPLPMDTMLVDEDGKPFRFGDAFDGDKPVLLTFVYLRCPVICIPLLEFLADGLALTDLVPGEEFTLVTVSIDPEETRHLTKVTKQRLVERYGRPGAADAWHFLRGSEEQIRALTDAAGFMYQPVPETNEFSHPATLILVTPDGRVARYLQGIPENPDRHANDIRLSLIETAGGGIGSAVDWFVLTCYHFDPDRGTYTVQAQRVMTMGGGLTVFILALFLVPRWLIDARRRRS